MRKENNGQCREKNKTFCKEKRAGEGDRIMVCLIFHVAIIIDRKNWRITIKLHFENFSIFFKKSKRTHPPPVRFCSLFNDSLLLSLMKVLFQRPPLTTLPYPEFWQI